MCDDFIQQLVVECAVARYFPAGRRRCTATKLCMQTFIYVMITFDINSDIFFIIQLVAAICKFRSFLNVSHIIMW